MDSNPQLSGRYEIVFGVAAATVVAVAVMALVSVYRHRDRLSRSVAGLWVLSIVLLPIAAPLAWFLVGVRATK